MRFYINYLTSLKSSNLTLLAIIISLITPSYSEEKNNPEKTNPQDKKERLNQHKSNSQPTGELLIQVKETPNENGKLVIYAYDVDINKGEIVKIFLNNHFTGILAGRNRVWNSSIFEIKKEWILLGENKIRYEIINNSPYKEINWSIIIANAQLFFNSQEKNATKVSNQQLDFRKQNKTIKTTTHTHIYVSENGNYKLEINLIDPLNKVVSSNVKNLKLDAKQYLSIETNIPYQAAANSGNWRISSALYYIEKKAPILKDVKEFNFLHIKNNGPTINPLTATNDTIYNEEKVSYLYTSNTNDIPPTSNTTREKSTFIIKKPSQDLNNENSKNNEDTKVFESNDKKADVLEEEAFKNEPMEIYTFLDIGGLLTEDYKTGSSINPGIGIDLNSFYPNLSAEIGYIQTIEHPYKNKKNTIASYKLLKKIKGFGLFTSYTYNPANIRELSIIGKIGISGLFIEKKIKNHPSQSPKVDETVYSPSGAITLAYPIIDDLKTQFSLIGLSKEVLQISLGLNYSFSF